MSIKHLFRAYLAFVIVKGIAMTIVATLLNVDFFRALILVLVSAIVTGAFGVVVAVLQSRENTRIHERLELLEQTSQQVEKSTHDIKGAVGANKRQEQTSDHPARRENDSP